MRDPKAIRRLLIVRNDHLGDLVLTLPAINYARQAFPEAEITVLAAERTEALLRGTPDVDRILADDCKSTSGALALRLKPFQFDAVAVIASKTRNCLAVWKARIPQRVMWAYKPAGLLLGTRRVTVQRTYPPTHETEFALDFVRRLKHDDAIQPTVPPLVIPESIRQQIASQLSHDLGEERPRFCVHPGSFKSAFNWPPDRYVELIERLARHGVVAITGGPSEVPLLESIYRRLSPGCQRRSQWYGHFNLLELAAAIAACNVLTVSNTGPMHLAGLIGTPFVALFSAEPWQSAKKWAPRFDDKVILEAPWSGRPPKRMRPEQIWDEMRHISADEALAANLSLLGKSAERLAPASARD